MANKPKTNYKPGGQDNMFSPPHALEPLYPIIPLHWRVWESATGEERILEKTLRKKGYDVTGTDICFGQDYFEKDPEFGYDIELTNVPFSRKYEWIAKAITRNKPFIFIVPYETTFPEKFQKVFNEVNGKPHELIVLSPERRINFKTPQFGWGEKVWDEKKQKEVMRGNSAQMPTCFLTYKMDLQIEAVYSNPLKTYYVPMRNAKYNDLNQEIVVKQNPQPVLFELNEAV